MPDGGELAFWVGAVYEGVVEGVMRRAALARPDQASHGRGPTQVRTTPNLVFHATVGTNSEVEMEVALSLRETREDAAGV